MNYTILVILSCMMIGTVVYAVAQEPIKIVESKEWGEKIYEKDKAKVTYKKLDMASIPMKKYKFCILAETEETDDLSGIIGFHDRINDLSIQSGHTILTARIVYPNKVQWQFYTTRPKSIEKIFNQVKLPVRIGWGMIEDPEWTEYLFHAN